MIKIVDFDKKHFQWVVDVASKKMLFEHLKRPDLYDPDAMKKLCGTVYKVGIGFVAEEDNKPVGIIAGLVINNLFNPKIKTLAEIVWFVEAESRKGRAGALLLKKFTNYGSDNGWDVTLSVLPSTEINFESLERYGFKAEELCLRKEGHGSN